MCIRDRIGKILIRNKVENQRAALTKTRRKDEIICNAISQCEAALNFIDDVIDHNQLMGLEGIVAKTFFAAYFQNQNWNCLLYTSQILHGQTDEICGIGGKCKAG